MPQALGELGKSKYSDVSTKIMNMLHGATSAVTRRALWKQVSNDLAKETELVDILKGMVLADKIQVVGSGYLPKTKPVNRKQAFVDFSLLREKKEGIV